MTTPTRDIDESGKMDGANDWQIFWKLLFPLVRPILVVSMILAFFGAPIPKGLVLVLHGGGGDE